MRFVSMQMADGGWHDVPETAYITYLLKANPSFNGNYNSAITWLRKNRIDGKAWGRCQRDIPRIPITSLVLSLLPELSDKASLNWLQEEWEKDLNASTKLSYKAAFTLLALATSKTPISIWSKKQSNI